MCHRLISRILTLGLENCCLAQIARRGCLRFQLHCSASVFSSWAEITSMLLHKLRLIQTLNRVISGAFLLKYAGTDLNPAYYFMANCEFYSFKIVIVGATSVGKSSLIRKYSEGIFEQHTESTIGVDLRLRTLNIQDQAVKLFFWDTAGQERFKSIVQTYYKSAKGVLFVIDLTDQNWKSGLLEWMREVNDHGDPNAVRFLIGNKVDLAEKRKVKDDEVREFAIQNGLQYYETSAKKGTNLQKVFETMGERLLSKSITLRHKQRQAKKSVNLVEEVKAKNGRCC